MKKILFLATAALFTLASCANDKPIEVGQLPAEAQKFLSTHFAAQKVVLATMDREFTHTSYEVRFADGGSVEFDGKGLWKDVECGGAVQSTDANAVQSTDVSAVQGASGATAAVQAVPAAIVPEAIGAHISANYPGMVVRQLSRGRNSWEVDLVAAPTNGARPRTVELKFDSAFRLVEIDD